MITSHTNKGIKEVIQLEQKSKVRKDTGLFIAEGMKMFMETPAERISKIYVTDGFLNQMPPACRAKLESIPSHYETVSDDLFKKMSDTKTPQGILCVVKQRQYKLEDMLSQPCPLLIILEDIQDPGNLGTIFRAGEGAGVSGIIMSGNTVDIYNPKTIRSTMGSVYRMPFMYVSSLDSVMDILKKSNIIVHAAHLQGSIAYDSCDYTKGTAFLIGNESNGLKEETAEMADVRIKIPMLGKVESLNAAVASAVLFYEAARQRRK